jgi:hypothetical protein
MDLIGSRSCTFAQKQIYSDRVYAKMSALTYAFFAPGAVLRMTTGPLAQDN